VSSVVTGAIGGAIGGALSPKAVTTAALLLFAALPFSTQPAGAQGVATTKDFEWLAGRWEGTMASGGADVADVTFTPSAGGLISGVMRLVANEKVVVVELISLTDTPQGPELRFRHFSNSLEAYEPTFKQALHLTSHAADRDVFENSVPYEKGLMSTQPRTTVFQRHDADTFTGRTKIINDDGKPAIVEVRYRRISAH